MKLRVLYSDGVFRGGMVRMSQLSPTRCRSWRGRAYPHCREFLLDFSGHDRASDAESWMIARIAKSPETSGPPDGRDSFDHDSTVTCITPREAVGWFREHSIEPPADLLTLARAGQAHPSWDSTVDESDQMPLPEGQQRVWDLLEGKALSAKDIARALDPKISEDAVRKRIEDIRRTGRTIDNNRTLGYFRLGSPPPELKGKLTDTSL